MDDKVKGIMDMFMRYSDPVSPPQRLPITADTPPANPVMYSEQQEAEALARLNKSLARDDILSRFDRGPLNELAMMAVGPTKFKGPVEGLVKLFPKRLDTVEAFPQLQKIVNILKGMGKGEQEAAIKAIKPKVLKDQDRINSIYKSDILNNPNYSSKAELMLNKNAEAYSKFDSYLDNLLSPKKLKGGGVANLMPLKYEV